MTRLKGGVGRGACNISRTRVAVSNRLTLEPALSHKFLASLSPFRPRQCCGNCLVCHLHSMPERPVRARANCDWFQLRTPAPFPSRFSPGSCVKECLSPLALWGCREHTLPRFSLPTLWLARCELRTRPRMRIEDGLHCSLVASVLTQHTYGILRGRLSLPFSTRGWFYRWLTRITLQISTSSRVQPASNRRL